MNAQSDAHGFTRSDGHRGIGGKLVYNASITVPGKTQKTEVVVDAMTGVVISKRP